MSEEFNLAARLTARLANLGQDYCVFTRSEREFAATVNAAREVLTGEPATLVPQAPAALVGVLNLRGEVLPLVQLDSLLGIPTRSYTAGDQIVVLSSGDIDIGLVVDRVRDVRAIPPAEIAEYPSGSPASHLCRGYWPSPTGLVSVLDPAKVIAAAVRAVSQRFQQRPSGQDTTAPAASSLSPSHE